MASPAGGFRPWRLILTFLVITAGLYGLVFLTPGANTPKLGIDLQGGTRITLTARTLDGSEPSRPSMQQARTIMESRVNGSGVAGAEVQIEGSRQIVITVPGNEDLNNLTRSAQLNIRPVLGGTAPVIATPADAPQPEAPASTPASTGATTTGPATGTDAATASGTAPTSPDPAVTTGSAPASAEVGPAGTAAPSTAASAAATAPASATTPAPGLRAAAPALAAPSDPSTPSAAPTTAAPTTGAPATDATATAPATDTAPVTATAPVTGTAPATGAAAAFPAGSNPDNPTQPAGADEASWTAWYSAAQTSLGGIGCADLDPYRGLDDPAKPLIACSPERDAIYLLEPTIIPGTEIDDATAGLSTTGGAGWAVNLTFKSDGYSTWSNYTASHVGTLTAMTLDGQVITAPSINQAITTPGTEISGSFTQESAAALANSLRFGALPLAFDRAESVNVSAQLGAEYLQAGLIAGGIGLLLVIIYCLIYYRLLGVITILSLILSFGLVYAVLVLLGRWIGLSLDMSGVAGLIIAIGITADSFVIYFERLKDEVREGRSFRSAVPRGWARAQRTILSADAVSFLSAFILYVLAIGEVRGFAFTLGLSTVLDLVVVYLVTHPLVALAAGSKVFASPQLSGLGGVAAAGRRQRASNARLATTEA